MDITGVVLVWSEGFGGTPFQELINDAIGELSEDCIVINVQVILGNPDLAVISYGKKRD